MREAIITENPAVNDNAAAITPKPKAKAMYQKVADRVARIANQEWFSDRYGWVNDNNPGLLSFYDNNPIVGHPEIRAEARERAIEMAAKQGYPIILAEGSYDYYTTSILFSRKG